MTERRSENRVMQETREESAHYNCSGYKSERDEGGKSCEKNLFLSLPLEYEIYSSEVTYTCDRLAIREE